MSALPILSAQQFQEACREGGRALERALLAMDRAFFHVCFRDSLRVLRNEHLAADAVQEGFVKVWQRCASFRADGDVLPWVRSIVRRTVLDHLRRQHPHEALEDEGGEVRAEVEAALQAQAVDTNAIATPEQRLEAQQRQALFDACCQRFEAAAPLHAQVLRWVAEDGLTPSDIAELIGRTPGATREFVSQARKKARLHFSAWHASVLASEGDAT